MLGFLLRKKASRKWLVTCIFLVMLPFLVPYSVAFESAQSESLAPAWVVAVFEQIQGNFVRAEDALRPIILVECVGFALVLIGLFGIKRLQSDG